MDVSQVVNDWMMGLAVDNAGPCAAAGWNYVKRERIQTIACLDNSCLRHAPKSVLWADLHSRKGRFRTLDLAEAQDKETAQGYEVS